MVAGGRLAEWVGRLVRIPSVNPAQAGPRAGTPGEARLAEEVARCFRKLGGEVHTEEVLPGRSNVYGLWSRGAGEWAGLDVHLDTVGVEQMTGDPFDGRIEGGRVYGRGAVDTKASLGIALALLEEARASGTPPGVNLLVSATVDEEVGAHGAPALAAWLRRRGLTLGQLAVAEPTGCRPVIAHKGVLRLQFDVEGVPAHTCQPEHGRNAVVAAARLALALDDEHQRLQTVPADPAMGAPTLTVSLIHGGRGANVVPDACSLTLDRRLVAGERAADVAGALEDLARTRCPLPLRIQRVKQIDAFSQARDAPWVRRLVEWSGQEPAVVPYCTNAWAYPGVTRECVVIGPGSIDQAHGTEEWVEIAELEKLAGIYARWWGLSK